MSDAVGFGGRQTHFEEFPTPLRMYEYVPRDRRDLSVRADVQCWAVQNAVFTNSS